MAGEGANSPHMRLALRHILYIYIYLIFVSLVLTHSGYQYLILLLLEAWEVQDGADEAGAAVGRDGLQGAQPFLF